MQRWAALCCVVIILCAAGLFYARLSTAVGATHTVAIDGVKFDPEWITVKVGDTVVWVKQDPVPHTVTPQAGGGDSHEIAAGQSWSYRTTRAGVFSYTCTFHPTIQATLQVE
jgi:plastocyanin